jgi:hypothetical protein
MPQVIRASYLTRPGVFGLCKLGQSHQGGQGWYAVRMEKFNARALEVP